MLESIKVRGINCKRRIKTYLSNTRGELPLWAKVLIGCVIAVAVLGITVYLLNFGKEKVEGTTQKIDTEYQNWSK